MGRGSSKAGAGGGGNTSAPRTGTFANVDREVLLAASDSQISAIAAANNRFRQGNTVSNNQPDVITEGITYALDDQGRITGSFEARRVTQSEVVTTTYNGLLLDSDGVNAARFQWNHSTSRDRLPTRPRVTASSVNNMSRSRLTSVAQSLFVRKQMRGGLSSAEALRRFNSLVGSNSDAQLRSSIKRWLKEDK